MEIVNGYDELQSHAGSYELVLTIGTFDGVHKGHQALCSHLSMWKQTLSPALKPSLMTALVTFTQPPRSVIEGEKPSLITSFETKCTLLEGWIDLLIVLPFDQKLQNLSSKQFLEMIHACCPIRALLLGDQASFGKQREGDQRTVEKIARELGFQLQYLPKTQIGGQSVSSSLIREKISKGDFQGAKELLGRDFFLEAKVKRGKELGSQITTVKTANLEFGDLLNVPRGVYCVKAMTSDGSEHPAVANVGVAPTLQENREVLCEVHLLDGQFSLYSEQLKVTFHKFLRPEKRFENSQLLKKQIQKDVEAAKHFWKIAD